MLVILLVLLSFGVAFGQTNWKRSGTVHQDTCDADTFQDLDRWCQNAAGIRGYFDGTTYHSISDAASATTPTLDEVCTEGCSVTTLTSVAPMCLGRQGFFDNGSGFAEHAIWDTVGCTGNRLSPAWRLQAGSDGTVVNSAGDTCWTVDEDDSLLTYSATGGCIRPKKTITFTAPALSADGTNCIAQTATINSWAGTDVIACADSNSSVMSLFLHMPDSWDAGTLVLKLDWVITDAQSSKVIAIDPLFTCSADGAQIAARPAQATTYQATATSGNQTNDHQTTTSPAITKSSGTCVAGGQVQMVIYIDATAFTATTPTTTVFVTGGAIEYSIVGNSD